MTDTNIAAPVSTAERPRGCWLVLIYRLPAQPSSARTAVWREIKRLGALSLQHAVCLLPLAPTSGEAYARLARKIEEDGGEATVLETAAPDAAWHDRTVGHFNAARDEVYAEVVDETERFCEGIVRDRRKGKHTFAELEDEEGHVERLRRFLAQVEGARHVRGRGDLPRG